MLGQVAAPFDLGKNAQQREQSATIGDVERLVFHQLQLRRIHDGVHQLVDGDVLVDDALGEFAVARQECVGRAGHRLTDEREDLDDLGTHLLVGGGNQGHFFVWLIAVAK